MKHISGTKHTVSFESAVPFDLARKGSTDTTNWLLAGPSGKGISLGIDSLRVRSMVVALGLLSPLPSFEGCGLSVKSFKWDERQWYRQLRGCSRRKTNGSGQRCPVKNCKRSDWIDGLGNATVTQQRSEFHVEIFDWRCVYTRKRRRREVAVWSPVIQP